MLAIVTGSFDPITKGHLEIIRYASKRYEKVFVVALVNEAKSYMFTLEQKKELIRLSVLGMENVIADAYSGMTADYMHKHGITQIIRGIRNEEDAEYEKRLADAMKKIDSSFETEFIVCDKEFAEISSTRVREAIKNETSLKGLVSENIENTIRVMYIENLNNKS